ncbi:GKAP1 protein, partial [Polyodon spathula]|nr:GKAP1 protein [Polyodon spathula]
MTSAVISSVPTTASRFALLQVDSDSDSDSEPGKGKGVEEVKKQWPNLETHSRERSMTGQGWSGFNTVRKEAVHESDGINGSIHRIVVIMLRSLAFKKLPQKSSLAASGLSLQNIAADLVHHSTAEHQAPGPNWQQWKQRDEQLTSELYETDLEKALILSKLEYEEHKKEYENVGTTSPKSKSGGKKDKKKIHQGKDKPVRVSLKDFQTEENIGHLNKKQEELKPVTVPTSDDRFFNKLEDDVSKILLKEKRREQLTSFGGIENCASNDQEPVG